MVAEGGGLGVHSYSRLCSEFKDITGNAVRACLKNHKSQQKDGDKGKYHCL